jgi:8-oxo-dGTP pyrophosphatase MutT (NUDIX family)
MMARPAGSSAIAHRLRGDLKLHPQSPPQAARTLDKLTPAILRERLAGAVPPPQPEDLPHMSAIPAGSRVTEAAVLVPIVNRPDALQLLLTQRTAHLTDHAGQISFPGGRVEAEDADREETALRETEEEIGVPRGRITVVGRLPEYDIATGFRITPVVGWIEPPFELALDAFEVACVFEAPLAHFLEPARYERREYHFGGRHRHYMAIPYEGRYIWGATAAMLYSLARMVESGGR